MLQRDNHKKIFISIIFYCKLLRISMGSDFIPDLQGVHQQSLKWPGGANAPTHPPVSAPAARLKKSQFRICEPSSVIGAECACVQGFLSRGRGAPGPWIEY